MSYQHSNVYIIQVTDTDAQGVANTWFAGPYGSTRADQTADELEAAAERVIEQNAPGALRDRKCTVEALFSDTECLRVDDYVRATRGSLY